MSSSDVRDHIENFVKGQVPWPFVEIENRNPKPPVDAMGRPLPFISLLYIAGETANSIGSPSNRCWREYGEAMVLFYVPSNTGMAAVLPVVENFRRVARGRSWRMTPPRIDIEIEAATPIADYISQRWGHSIGDYAVKVVNLSYRSDSTDA